MTDIGQVIYRESENIAYEAVLQVIGENTCSRASSGVRGEVVELLWEPVEYEIIDECRSVILNAVDGDIDKIHDKS